MPLMPLAVSHWVGVLLFPPPPPFLLLQWGWRQKWAFWLLPEIVIIGNQSGSSNLGDKGEREEGWGDAEWQHAERR